MKNEKPKVSLAARFFKVLAAIWNWPGLLPMLRPKYYEVSLLNGKTFLCSELKVRARDYKALVMRPDGKRSQWAYFMPASILQIFVYDSLEDYNEDLKRASQRLERGSR